MVTIILGAVLLILVVAMLSFATANSLRQELDERLGIGSQISQEVPDERSALKYTSHLGGKLEDEKKPDFVEKDISTDYVLKYTRRIYVNNPFHLKVLIGKQKDADIPPEHNKDQNAGELFFTHSYLADSEPIPDPKIKVELKYAGDEFLITTTSLTKYYIAGQITEFDFLIKPIKAEPLSLVVEISYMGISWQDRQLTQIQIAEDVRTMTTTTTWSPAQIIENVQILKRENLVIDTKSFFVFNAANLGIIKYLVSVVLSFVYVGIAIATGRTDNTLNAVIVGVSALVSSLGIPLAADLWKNLTPEQNENEDKK